MLATVPVLAMPLSTALREPVHDEHDEHAEHAEPEPAQEVAPKAQDARHAPPTTA